MDTTFICPQGHRWEPGVDAPGEGHAGRECPVCGAPALPAGCADGAEIPGTRPEQSTRPPTAEAVTADRANTADLPCFPPSNLDASAAELPRVPGYEVQQVLDAGGMGVVYRARHLRLGIPVALKMIRGGDAPGPQELARFQREARAVARLNHPGVVRIYDYGQYGGLPFFTMELMEGGTLAAALRRGPLPDREAARLVETLARTLHVVHDRGLIHRDLKPGNVLFAADGTPRLADFGLAKRPGEDTELTHTGAVMGTASYMAPEQAAGRADVGPAADVYALGGILYEALTGRPPFRAATRELTLLQVLGDQPEPPSHVRSEVASELEAITLKCLEKDPARRYATAAAVADDLGRFLAGEPVSVAADGGLGWHAQWARVAGYEVLDLLGCGPSGFLYRARQVSLNRPVALKLFPASFRSRPRLLARFRREAEAAARLQSPNILQFYDFGERGGQLFWVTEYVGGGTLTARYAARSAGPREAAALIRTAAQALEHAHQCGVVHLALQPSSILLTPGGVPKIVGFGSAIFLGEEAAAPADDPADLRAPTYRAPEQVADEARPPGPATDVYALGAILYYLLAGQGPFQGETMQERRRQVLCEEPVPPSQIQTGIPAELEAVCLRCLRKAPAERFATAQELADHLDRFLICHPE